MMHIKIATKENISDIAKIEQACFSAPWSEDSIAESLDNPASHFLIAYYGDEVAGYMGLQIFSGEGYVTNVAVLPKFRKKGIAKAKRKFILSRKQQGRFERDSIGFI